MDVKGYYTVVLLCTRHTTKRSRDLKLQMPFERFVNVKDLSFLDEACTFQGNLIEYICQL